MKKWGVVPFPELLLLFSHESLLSIQRYQQYPQCPVWFFIPEIQNLGRCDKHIKQNECFEIYRIPPRAKGKDGKTEAQSVYLFRKKDQRGHWVWWMSTIGKNGLMSRTHILSVFLGYFGVQYLLHAATTARLFCQWNVESHSSVGRIHASLAVNYRRLKIVFDYLSNVWPIWKRKSATIPDLVSTLKNRMNVWIRPVDHGEPDPFEMLRDRFKSKIRQTAKRSTRHALQHGGVTGGRSHVRRATNNPVQVTSNPAKVVKNVKINVTGGEHEGGRSTRQHLRI